ncbi:MAG: class I SAM-dependent methyltransferase [Saprospiraceae bacterium]|nr:class I SAM-dependent methyltransferase [Saprospiraceae bacterium]
MSPKKIYPAKELFDSFADLYQEKYMDVTKYHDSLNLFCQFLPHENANILELACGPGNITKYLFSCLPNLKIFATDISEKMLHLAKINNPKADCAMLDCRNIRSLDSTYDAVICGFGLPYLTKEEALNLIDDATHLLNPEGLIYLSTMEDEYIKSGFQGSSQNPDEGLNMYFHEAEYLSNKIESSGMKILHISRITYLGPQGKDVTDLILIAKKRHK